MKKLNKPVKKIEFIDKYEAAPPPNGDWSTKITYSDYEWLISLINVTRTKLNELIDYLNTK